MRVIKVFFNKIYFYFYLVIAIFCAMILVLLRDEEALSWWREDIRPMIKFKNLK
jgi:hypothetical protein